MWEIRKTYARNLARKHAAARPKKVRAQRAVTKVPSLARAKSDPTLMELRRNYCKEASRLWKERHPAAAKAAQDKATAKVKADPIRSEVKRVRSRARMTNLRVSNPDHIRFLKKKHMYGITEAAYNVLLNKQNGVCAICKKPENSVHKKSARIYALSVDHCHITKRIRGLLCHRCNKGLGLFKDNVLVLLAAGCYLLET